MPGNAIVILRSSAHRARARNPRSVAQLEDSSRSGLAREREPANFLFFNESNDFGILKLVVKPAHFRFFGWPKFPTNLDSKRYPLVSRIPRDQLVARSATSFYLLLSLMA